MNNKDQSSESFPNPTRFPRSVLGHSITWDRWSIGLQTCSVWYWLTNILQFIISTQDWSSLRIPDSRYQHDYPTRLTWPWQEKPSLADVASLQPEWRRQGLHKSTLLRAVFPTYLHWSQNICSSRMITDSEPYRRTSSESIPRNITNARPAIIRVCLLNTCESTWSEKSSHLTNNFEYCTCAYKHASL